MAFCSLDIRLSILTDFYTAEMRTSNNIHGGPISSDDEIEGDDDPPVFDKWWDTIDQTPEECQERELDSHHCHPSEYKACGDQLTKFENRV